MKANEWGIAPAESPTFRDELRKMGDGTGVL
jgi:hypothetical protein